MGGGINDLDLCAGDPPALDNEGAAFVEVVPTVTEEGDQPVASERIPMDHLRRRHSEPLRAHDRDGGQHRGQGTQRIIAASAACSASIHTTSQ